MKFGSVQPNSPNNFGLVGGLNWIIPMKNLVWILDRFSQILKSCFVSAKIQNFRSKFHISPKMSRKIKRKTQSERVWLWERQRDMLPLLSPLLAVTMASCSFYFLCEPGATFMVRAWAKCAWATFIKGADRLSYKGWGEF